MKNILANTKEEYKKNEIFWATYLSDGVLHKLRPEGETTPVLYEDRIEYVKESVMARLVESRAQCNAIKRGISKIIPSSLLNIVTCKELEIWVCGKNVVDVDLLKRHTQYGGSRTEGYKESSPVIQMFWQFLRELREDEKQKFIKFCWGQERIPANDGDFTRNNVRFMIKPEGTKASNQDGMLPKADTCFFNFELPNYSSIEIMRQKILQAITLDCVSMNAEQDAQREARRHGFDNDSGYGSEEMEE